MKKHPNIVYLHSHDTGRYIQPYGYAVETPNMQRFAEEGVLFRNAFCAAPTCSPRPGCAPDWDVSAQLRDAWSGGQESLPAQ